MALKIAANPLDNCKLGISQVDKIYLGRNALWEHYVPQTYVEYETMRILANNNSVIELPGIVPNDTTELRFSWFLDTATNGFVQDTTTNNVVVGEFDTAGVGYGIIQQQNAQTTSRVDIVTHMINGETQTLDYITTQDQRYVGSRGINSPSNEYHSNSLYVQGSNPSNFSWRSVTLLVNPKVCTKDLVIFGGYRNNVLYPLKQRQTRLSSIYLNHNNVEYDLRICKRQSDNVVCLVDVNKQLVFAASGTTIETLTRTGNSWTF